MSSGAWLAMIVVVMAIAGCTRDPAALFANAKRYQEQGNRTEAIIELKSLLQQDPKHGDARFLLGKLYNEDLDAGSAEKELRRALDLGMIEGGRVRAELGRALLQENKFKAVLDEIKPLPVYEADPLASIHAFRGQAHLQLRQFKEAKQMLGEGIGLSPDNPDVLLSEALFMIVEKRQEQAIEKIERAISRDPKHVHARMMRADLMILKRDYDGALASYSKILETNPRSFATLGARATLHVRTGKLAEAQKDVSAMLKINRNHPIAVYLQGLVDFHNGKFREAEAAALAALKIAPDYGPAQMLSGVSQFMLGSHLQAERTLTSLVRRYPGNEMVRKLLATSYIEMNQPRRALEIVEPMIARNPKDAATLAIASDALMKANEYTKATELLERAVAIDPKDESLRLGLALGRMAGGDVQSGLAELEAIAARGLGKFKADYLLVTAYLGRNEFDKALDAARVLEKKQPDNPITHKLVGSAYLGKKDAANARKSFERALALQPHYLPALLDLVNMDVSEGNRPAAKKRLEDAIASDKANVRAMVALAELLAENRRLTKESVQWLEKARQANATALVPRVMLARHYIEASDRQAALTVAQEAVNAHPGNADALDALGRAQLASGDTNSALGSFTRLAKAAPDSALAQYRLGVAHAELKRHKQAEESFRKALKAKPEFPEAQLALTALLTLNKRTGEALAFARQVQIQSPRSPVGFMLEGDVLTVQKKHAEAARRYETAFNLQKSGPLAVKVYTAHVSAGNRDAGFAALAQWISESPGDLAGRMYLADGLSQIGQLKAAVEHYEYISQKAPNDPLVLNNLANYYQQTKDKRALEYAERAQRIQPQNPLVADTLGWILLEQGNTARAVELLQGAAAKAPQHLTIRYHLAVALAQAGEKRRAREELEKLVASGRRFPELDQAKALLQKL